MTLLATMPPGTTAPAMRLPGTMPPAMRLPGTTASAGPISPKPETLVTAARPVWHDGLGRPGGAPPS